MSDTREARKRSVNHLQQLYTVVVALAVTESLGRLLLSLRDNGQLPPLNRCLMFFSLIFTVVPFYHGANRYLDATYVTGERAAKSSALLLDFIFLFIEGLLFFGLAVLATNEVPFYTVLAMLLVLDAIWVGLTSYPSIGDTKRLPYFKWAVVNLITAAIIFIFVWSNLFGFEFWSTPTVRNVALVAVVAFRTVYDYFSTWNFYYPDEKKIQSTETAASTPASDSEVS